jgi:hypothetical protein
MDGPRCQLVVAINDIDHIWTRIKTLQTHGVYEHFHKTILQKVYQVRLRRKLYRDIKQLQQDLDVWILRHSKERTHQAKMCCGTTPMAKVDGGMKIWAGNSIGEADA